MMGDGTATLATSHQCDSRRKLCRSSTRLSRFRLVFFFSARALRKQAATTNYAAWIRTRNWTEKQSIAISNWKRSSRLVESCARKQTHNWIDFDCDWSRWWISANPRGWPRRKDGAWRLWNLLVIIFWNFRQMNKTSWNVFLPDVEHLAGKKPFPCYIALLTASDRSVRIEHPFV